MESEVAKYPKKSISISVFIAIETLKDVIFFTQSGVICPSWITKLNLKRKAEHCKYGDQKEGFICDMIINGIDDS